MSEKEVREWKSNSFSLLMKEKRYALETFNALNRTRYEDPEEIEIQDIDGGFSITVRGDAIFILNWNVVLFEQQSTVNENMPLRFLIYVVTFYKHYIKGKNVYGKKLIKLPTPQFVCFYNGKEKLPEKQVLRLSDAFERRLGAPALELQCTVHNITEGNNTELKNECVGLSGYMTYVNRVNRNLATMERDLAIETAIDSCIQDDVLSDFFRRNRTMILTADALDYTYETRIELERRDAREEGENNLSLLIQALLRDGRQADIDIATKDEVARKRMYNEYGIM